SPNAEMLRAAAANHALVGRATARRSKGYRRSESSDSSFPIAALVRDNDRKSGCVVDSAAATR
ncbi:MAG: hypothetical protein WA660_03445, partial [Candidatus Acidiferrales bacterium]